MLAPRLKDLPRMAALPAESSVTMGLMLSAAARRPLSGLTRPPRTMYFSVFTSTHRRVRPTQLSASRAISSNGRPARTASAIRRTIKPSETDRCRESTTATREASSPRASRALSS